MKQLQFYKYATLALLFLNLSMIAFFFLTKPPGPARGGKRINAEKIMKLDEQQHTEFFKFAGQHMRQMDGFDKQQSNLLKPYFNTLIESKGNIDLDSLLDQVVQLERKKIESTYQHFQDVKTILKPEQQAYFEDFVEHALEVILLENMKPNPPPKEN